MLSETDKLKIQKLQQAKFRRWMWYALIIVPWVLSCASRMLRIFTACHLYGYSIADIVGASGFAMGGKPTVEPWPLISAGIQFHQLLLGLLIGTIILAGAQYCFNMQDLAIRTYEEKNA